MGQGNEQLKRGQNRRKRIVYLIMGSFLIWAVYTWYGQKAILEKKEAELAKVEHELEQLKQERDALQYTIQRLHDPEYIANLARKYYYLSKEGEIIFEIVTEEKEN